MKVPLPPTASITPLDGYTHTFIILHPVGRGALPLSSTFSQDCHDSANKSLGELFPKFRWEFPSASFSRTRETSNETEQYWFRASDHATTSETTEEHTLLQLQDLRTSVSRIRDIVWAEVRSLNYQLDRVILAGIGQGATALPNLDVPSKSQDSL